MALELVREVSDRPIGEWVVSPDSPVSMEELATVHCREYLDSLTSSSVIAKVMEVPFLRFLPKMWLKRWFIEPARWSVSCSLMAARLALRDGFCMSFGGGFHHAKRGGGEGFCLVNDIAFVVETFRAEGILQTDDVCFYIDLDIHQGNGVSDYYQRDPGVKILDMFESANYPTYGRELTDFVEVPIPLDTGCKDEVYLSALKQGLDSLFSLADSPALIIYNAGTDIYEGDKLGGFRLSRSGVNQRDLMVYQAAQKREIPLVSLASGGYSKMSAVLLSDFAIEILRLRQQLEDA